MLDLSRFSLSFLLLYSIDQLTFNFSIGAIAYERSLGLEFGAGLSLGVIDVQLKNLTQGHS
jgi:hypothetical protein